jgi:hypothetical protein
MYDWLPEVCRELRGNLIEIYWLSIVPLTLMLIILEFFKLPENEPNALKVIKRAVISIILLISFDEVIHTIALVGDGIVEAISPRPYINQVLEEVWKHIQEIELSWYKYKETIIWVFSLMSFILAYLGAFIADALVHFCWAILFVLSPLMILAYIPESTAKIATGLYRSLCTVMAWKILWSILGVILLRFTANAPISSGDNYNAILLIVINLFIGISMLIVPIATKAFLSADFAAFSGGLAAVPAMASKKILVSQLKKAGRFSASKGKGAISQGFRSTGRAFKGVGKSRRGGPSDPKHQGNRGSRSGERFRGGLSSPKNSNKGDRHK